METCNITDRLSQALGEVNPEANELESVQYGHSSVNHIQTLLTEPKTVLKTLGFEVSDESNVQVTVKDRANRKSSRRRTIVVIIIKWKNCDTDIIVVVTG